MTFKYDRNRNRDGDGDGEKYTDNWSEVRRDNYVNRMQNIEIKKTNLGEKC